MGTAKGKMSQVENQLNVLVPDFVEIAAEGTGKELDKAALEISTQWDRLEMGIRELESNHNAANRNNQG